MRCATSILPDNGVIDWFSGLALPDHDSLALIGNSESGHIVWLDPSAHQRLYSTAHLRGEDFSWIMLNPAGFEVDLLEFLLRDGDDCAGVVEENCTRAGGSLVE